MINKNRTHKRQTCISNFKGFPEPRRTRSIGTGVIVSLLIIRLIIASRFLSVNLPTECLLQNCPVNRLLPCQSLDIETRAGSLNKEWALIALLALMKRHANEPSVDDFCPIVDGEMNELQIGKGQTKAVINDFNPTKEYAVKVIAVSGSQQSRALQGSFAGKKTHSKHHYRLADHGSCWLDHCLCFCHRSHFSYTFFI